MAAVVWLGVHSIRRGVAGGAAETLSLGHQPGGQPLPLGGGVNHQPAQFYIAVIV